MTGNTLRISIEWHDYNPRRYGKPWIAVVTAWPLGGRPELKFGGYVGDHQCGELEMASIPGDIIRYGQRDGRANSHVSKWAVVLADGSIRHVTQVVARRLYCEVKRA